MQVFIPKRMPPPLPLLLKATRNTLCADNLPRSLPTDYWSNT